MANTAVAEKKEAALPAVLMENLEQHAGAGMDMISTDNMQIPFVRVAQQMSKQLNKQEPVFIKGMTAGDIYNTVTGEFWDSESGVIVIPCGFTVKYLEFLPKGDGGQGGYVGELQATDPDIRATSREGSTEILPNGNELIRSAQHLVMIVDPETGATQTAIMDFKKTGMKVSKRWNTMMKMVQYPGKNGMFSPPMWATVWKMTTAQESNNQGSWFNFQVERIEPTEVPGTALNAAKEFFESFQKGEIKTGTGEVESETASAQQADDVPF